MIYLLTVLALQPQLGVQVLRSEPIASAEEQAVMLPINETFKALESGDSAALLPHVYPEGKVTAAGTTANGVSGVRTRSWTEYAARMTKGQGFKERITSPEMRIDGDIAMVWAPFTIERGGEIVACGYDLFDMVRENSVWKIMNITFSTRTTGCPGK